MERFDTLPAPWFCPRMVYTSCGIIGAFAELAGAADGGELDRAAVAVSVPG